jgi:uncharacterized membrane protein (UPF0127 family)
VAWLLRDGEVLASLEVASSFARRLRGLLGRDGIDGAFLVRPAKSVHTIGMRFPIDVAFLDRDLEVLRTVTMAPWRPGRAMLRAHAVLEAPAGAFTDWGLTIGEKLEIKGD